MSVSDGKGRTAKVYGLSKRPDFFKDEFIDPKLDVDVDKTLSKEFSEAIGIPSCFMTLPKYGVGVFCNPQKVYGVWGRDEETKKRISRFWDKYECSIMSMINEAKSLEEIIHTATLILNGFAAENKNE